MFDKEHSTIEKKKILIVEDEKELARLISFHVAIAGYEALSAQDGFEAIEMCKCHKPELVVLDIMLPKIDGWEVCRRLKQDAVTRSIPVIILSALSEVHDRLKGFDLGADDYVTKPFSPRELVVRVKRVLSRTESRFVTPRAVKVGDCEIDTTEMVARRDNQEVPLTSKEKAILMLFLAHPGTVFNHGEIIDAVWGEGVNVEYGNVDVHIRHLREKLEKNPCSPRFIRTVKGQGYRFEP